MRLPAGEVGVDDGDADAGAAEVQPVQPIQAGRGQDIGRLAGVWGGRLNCNGAGEADTGDVRRRGERPCHGEWAVDRHNRPETTLDGHAGQGEQRVAPQAIVHRRSDSEDHFHPASRGATAFAAKLLAQIR